MRSQKIRNCCALIFLCGSAWGLSLDNNGTTNTLNSTTNCSGTTNVGGTTLTLDCTNKRVGVNAATPATAFQVSSGTLLLDGNAPALNITGVGSVAAPIQVGVSTLTLTGAGNLGIGTSNPVETLDVNGNTQIGQVSKTTISVTGQTTLGAGTATGAVGLTLQNQIEGGVKITSTSSCGNTVVVTGDGQHGVVTAGSAAVATCCITWAPAYTNGSNCSWINISRALATSTIVNGTTSSTVTFSGSWTAADKLQYDCTGR